MLLTTRLIRNILLSGLICLGATSWAQTPLITIAGRGVDPSVLSRHTIRAIGHDSKEHRYTGALLADILAQGGLTLGDKRASINSYLLMKAKDNYTSVFSLAEIDPLFSSQQILVADQIDGKKLDSAATPFQLIVPQDKLQTRWVRQLISIEIFRIN